MTTPTPTGSAPDQPPAEWTGQGADADFFTPARTAFSKDQPSAQTVKPAGLIERLEAAEVGSRELDAEIYQAMGFEVKHQTEWQDRWRFSRSYAFLRDGRWQAIAHLTTSFDAALAMAERVLDRPYVWVGKNRGMSPSSAWSCELVTGDDFKAPSIETDAYTGPLAICAATLKATGEPR